MILQSVKNIQFSRLIKTGNRQREFNFRKLNSLDNQLYSVDVVDERGERIMFLMQKKNEQWELSEQNLPYWIGAALDKLGEAIEEFV